MPVFFSHLKIMNLEDAAKTLKSGGIVIYPTETYRAIGCVGEQAGIAEMVCRIKGRDPHKPMPLIAADLEQANLAADLTLAPRKLLAVFWPGPLTVLLPGRSGVAPQCRNAAGEIAIRVSASLAARRLAKLAGWPLAASSANISGRRPARGIADLDRELLDRLAASGLPCGIAGRGDPEYIPAKPSTLVRCCQESGFLQILREGAVPAASLKDAGFHIMD